MTDEANHQNRRGISADLDHAVCRAKAYLGSRTASDWSFFACGVLLGHFLL